MTNKEQRIPENILTRSLSTYLQDYESNIKLSTVLKAKSANLEVNRSTFQSKMLKNQNSAP